MILTSACAPLPRFSGAIPDPRSNSTLSRFHPGMRERTNMSTKGVGPGRWATGLPGPYSVEGTMGAAEVSPSASRRRSKSSRAGARGTPVFPSTPCQQYVREGEKEGNWESGVSAPFRGSRPLFPALTQPLVGGFEGGSATGQPRSTLLVVFSFNSPMSRTPPAPGDTLCGCWSVLASELSKVQAALTAQGDVAFALPTPPPRCRSGSRRATSTATRGRSSPAACGQSTRTRRRRTSSRPTCSTGGWPRTARCTRCGCWSRRTTCPRGAPPSSRSPCTATSSSSPSSTPAPAP